MIKTILLMLSLIFSGCASQLAFSRISQIDLSQCELEETWENYNSMGMILYYYDCGGLGIATVTEQAGMWSRSENMIGGINYKNILHLY